MFYDYIARDVPFGPDDGTLAPWAVVASLPFAPEIVLPTIQHYERMELEAAWAYGYKASFNPSFPVQPKHEHGWVSPHNVGLNQGPIVLMIENHRSNVLWSLMRQCPYLVTGLRRAGFTGGWLEHAHAGENPGSHPHLRLTAHRSGFVRMRLRKRRKAVALFCYQAKKWIGALAAALGGLDTLVFAGGIGANAAIVRTRICEGLGFIGITITRHAIRRTRR